MRTCSGASVQGRDFNSIVVRLRTERAGRLSSVTTSFNGPECASRGWPFIVSAIRTSPGMKAGIDLGERKDGLISVRASGDNDSSRALCHEARSLAALPVLASKSDRRMPE